MTVATPTALFSTTRSLIFILLLAIATALSSFWLHRVDWSRLQEADVGLGAYTILQYTVMMGCMLAYWYLGPKSNRWQDHTLLIIVAIIIRLLLIPIDPYTSNDIERYIFDGKVALEGFDPYHVSHDADALLDLRNTWPTPQEHAKYVTLYPPGAISLFAFSAAFGPDVAPIIWKTLLGLASVATLLFMVPILVKLQRLKHLSLVALSPILIFEAGVGAHLDAITSMFVVLAILCYQNKKMAATGLMIGLGTVIKLFPVLLLLPLCIARFNLKRSTTIAIAATSIIFSAYGIAIMLGMHPVGSTPVFFEKWRNASPFIDVINNYLKGEILLVFILSVLTIGFGTIALSIFRRSTLTEKDDSLIRAIQWTLSLPLLLSPVVFPWYLMSLVPLFAIRPTVFLFAWLSLIPVTYEVLNRFTCCNIWEPAVWPVVLLGLGLLLGFVIDMFNHSKRLTQVNVSCLR
ncbi:MAG: glycosyltransferase 87 family protein [Pseudomonadota bacterium]